MNKLQLLLTLRRHIRLSERRSLTYEQNRHAKLMVGVAVCIVVADIVFFSILSALAANDSDYYESSEFLFGAMPFILSIDFLLRFIGQQTPAQFVKPYLLLPIPKYSCVESFILSSLASPINLLWTMFTVPYVIMTTVFSGGLLPAMGIVLSAQLLVLANSQWYLLARSLISKSLVWWLLPVAAYGLLYAPIAFCGIDAFFDFFAVIGPGFAHWHLLPWAMACLALIALVEANKRVQFRLTYDESSGAEEQSAAPAFSFRFFDRYGEIGEYLKIEAKSLMRNKNLRKTFIYSTLIVLLLSLTISFGDFGLDSFSRPYWAAYVFDLYGAMMLIRIMCAEGNYIDGLMVHKENIELLLRAKYYFFCALLLLPLLVMFPTALAGRYTPLMLLSMASFAAGPVYCMLMQMAVCNRTTIPLNTKLTSRGSFDANYVQTLAVLIVMFAPVAFISVFRLFLSESMTYALLLVISAAFIVTHRLWIRNIYKRFMRRRYVNMEGFRASR